MKDFSNGPAGLRSDYPEPHKLLYRPSACKISGMILKVSVISHREKQHQYLWVKLDTGEWGPPGRSLSWIMEIEKFRILRISKSSRRAVVRNYHKKTFGRPL